MAPPTVPKITIHKHLASVDMKSSSTQKPFEAYTLLKQVKLKQRRLTSNQIYKHTDLKADLYSGSSKGCPSTENTETPSEFKSGKSSTLKSLSIYQRNDKNITVKKNEKQKENLAENCQNVHVIDPIELPNRSSIQPKFNFEDDGDDHNKENLKGKSITEPCTNGLAFLEKSLNLSLSMIEQPVEPDLAPYKFLEVSTVTRVSLDNSIDNSKKSLSQEEEGFGVMEDSLIPEAFKKVNISNIKPKEIAYDDIDAEFDSIEMLLVPNLSVSSIQEGEEKQELSRLSIIDDLVQPDLDLSAIQIEEKLEDDSDLKAINNLIVEDDLSLKIENFEAQTDFNWDNQSDREALEEALCGLSA